MDWPIVCLILGLYLISAAVYFHAHKLKSYSVDSAKEMREFLQRIEKVEFDHIEIHKLSKDTQKLLSESHLAKSLRPVR